MTRPRPKPFSVDSFMSPDPVGQAVLTDSLGIASELEALLASLAGIDESRIKGILFKKPNGIGETKYQIIEEVPAPIDFGEVMQSCKVRFGGGDYRLSIFADKKLRKQADFSIFGEPIKPNTSPHAQAPAADPLAGDRLIMLMMNQQAEARRDMMDQQRFAMEQQSRRDTQLMQTLGLILPAALPLMFGGREKLGDLIAIMNANKPEEKGLKETVETLVAVKGLLENPDKSPGFDADNLVGSFARLAGPIASAAGRAFGSGRRGEAAEEEEAPAAGDGTLQLPPPAAAAAPVLHMPHAPAAAPGPPVLNLIKPHVLYFFNAHLDPGLAAEAVADIMERENVTEDDVSGLVAAFSLSPDWKADLAAQGIDLRSDPEWADDFLSELVSVWTSGDRGNGRPGGATGGVAHAEDDAGAGAGGGQLHDHPRPGA